MAQQVQVLLVDDVDGGDAEETVTFGLDGVTYEIDLNADNAAALRESMSQWVGHARRVGGRRTAGAAPGRRTRAAAAAARGGDAPDTATVREWARENGFEVSERGRISGAVLEAYQNAH